VNYTDHLVCTVRIVKSGQLRWAGRVTWMRETRTDYKILMGETSWKTSTLKKRGDLVITLERS
jgi:hypothetical protein